MAKESAIAVVCVGMAGSGKTTFMQRINSHLHTKREPPYVVNLDPAVLKVPFESNIDIRDSVNYKEVMKQYRLGPNGGILTSLNLFATKIDQILALLEKRAGPGIRARQTSASEEKSDSKSSEKSKESNEEKSGSANDEQTKPIKHILVDTPGQIEVFVWSASGDILLGSLASSFPTVIAYIIDTPRTASTSTFMSNMLYACSILYKTKLPMILVFNKTDVKDAGFAKEWMTDFEAFQAALRQEEATGSFGGVEGGETSAVGGGSGYMGSLLNSMSLMLEEFYNHLDVVAVSAATGHGIDDFFDAVQNKAEEFERDYLPELERRWKEREAEKERPGQHQDLGRMMEDMRVDEGRAKTSRPPRKPEPETISDIEDEEEEEDDETGGLVDPDTDEDEDEDEDDEDDTAGQNLSDRYKRAIGRGGGQNNPSGEDLSFAKYIHAANVQ